MTGAQPDIPVLDTARLRLRGPRTGDIDAYGTFFADAAVSRVYGGPLSRTAAWNRLAQDIGHWALRGYGVWAVTVRAEARFVGVCGLVWPEGWPRPELTWWILPDARRQGYAREASQAVIAWAQANGWHRVETHMKDENEPARALALALGGENIARTRFPDGFERDVFAFAPPDRG